LGWNRIRQMILRVHVADKEITWHLSPIHVLQLLRAPSVCPSRYLAGLTRILSLSVICPN
jgi:hypothetical protein